MRIIPEFWMLLRGRKGRSKLGNAVSPSEDAYIAASKTGFSSNDVTLCEAAGTCFMRSSRASITRRHCITLSCASMHILRMQLLGKILLRQRNGNLGPHEPIARMTAHSTSRLGRAWGGIYVLFCGNQSPALDPVTTHESVKLET